MTRVAVRGPWALHLAAHSKARDEGFTIIPVGPTDAPAGADILVEDLDTLHRIEPKPADDGIYCVVNTSGTKGRPKPIEIPLDCLKAHREAANARMGCGPDSVWAAGVHPWRIGGIALVDRTLNGGGTFRPDALATDEGVTHASVVPTTLYRWVTDGIKPPASLQCLLVGGDHLSQRLAEAALELGWPVYATYGLTEACSQVATATPQELRDYPGTVGVPLDGVEVSIVDEQIFVDGPTVVGDAIATGDLGRFEDGRLYITGRVDDRIISGGVNVDPAHVEEALLACPGIDEACVVGRADEEWGQRLHAYIVGEADPDDVNDWVREHLTPPERPLHVTRLERLPRNDQGKVVRKRLPVPVPEPEEEADD